MILTLYQTNVKGLKLTRKKQIKLLEFFQSKLAPSGIIFAQETHSIKKIEQKWKVELNGIIDFCMENSIRVVFL